MNSQKFKTNSFCVGGKKYSETKNIAVEITIHRKTGKENKLLVGKCSICKRKKSMIVSDNTIQAEGLGDFFKNLRKNGLNVPKKMAKYVTSNPRRALDLTAKLATAAVSKNSKQALSTLPELITLYKTGEGLYLGKFVYFTSYQSIKNVIDYTHLHHWKK